MGISQSHTSRISQITRKIRRFVTDFKGCAGRMEYGLSCLLILIILPAFIHVCRRS